MRDSSSFRVQALRSPSHPEGLSIVGVYPEEDTILPCQYLSGCPGMSPLWLVCQSCERLLVLLIELTHPAKDLTMTDKKVTGVGGATMM